MNNIIKHKKNAIGTDIFGDPRLGYDLTLYDNTTDSFQWSHNYTLTGQIYGFGKNGGNYGGEEWLQKNVDGDISYDSESGQFFAYSNNIDDMIRCFGALDWAIDQIQNVTSILD